MRRRGWIGLAIGALVGGCVTPGDVTSSIAPNGTAGRGGLLVVYRPEGTLMTRGEPPIITVAGKRYGSLRAGQYFEVRVPEGEVKVTAQQAVLLVVPTIPKSIEVAVIGTGTSYVRVDQVISSAGVEGGMTINQEVQIGEVTPEVALAELAGLKPVP